MVVVNQAFLALCDLLKSANADVLDNCRKMMEQYVGERQSTRPSAGDSWQRLLNNRVRTFAEADYLLLRQGLGRPSGGALRVELDENQRSLRLVGNSLPGALGIVVGVPHPSCPGQMEYSVIPVDHLHDQVFVFAEELARGPVTLMTFDEHHITGCWQGSIDIDNFDGAATPALPPAKYVASR